MADHQAAAGGARKVDACGPVTVSELDYIQVRHLSEGFVVELERLCRRMTAEVQSLSTHSVLLVSCLEVMLLVA